MLGQYWDSDKQWFASREAPMVLGRRFPEPLWLAMRPYVVHQLIGRVQLMNRLVDDAQKPWPGRLVVAFPGIAKEPATTGSRLYLLTLPFSRWGAVNAHRTRTVAVGTVLASVRTTMAAIAVEQYRQGHGGEPPSKLDDLVPAHLPSVPIDPFSGGPLRYRREAEGYTIYSLGENQKDNGGGDARMHVARRFGPNQAQDLPADIGVQVRVK